MLIKVSFSQVIWWLYWRVDFIHPLKCLQSTNVASESMIPQKRADCSGPSSGLAEVKNVTQTALRTDLQSDGNTDEMKE